MTNLKKIYKYYYIYKTLNLINKKCYVGFHVTNKEYDKDTYFGSGCLLKKAIKKYGIENFVKGIIEYVNVENWKEKETFWIIKMKSHTSQWGYNQTYGGEGSLGRIVKKESKQKSSKTNKGKHTGKNNPMYGKSVYQLWIEKYGIKEANRLKELKRQKLSKSQKGEKNGFFGKTHTKEKKEQWKRERKGKHLSEEHKSNIKKTHPNYKGENHPNFGKKLKDHKIRKLCIYCKKEYTLKNYKKWHGNNCKFKK
jgi:group I intron endonuclease